MRKDMLYPARVLHGEINEYITDHKYYHFLRYPKKKKVFLVGTPEHTNIGDSAIVLAEIEFLKKCGFREKNIKEITVDSYYKYKKWILKCVKSENLICWHGGGNMGDQWLGEEKLRRQCIKIFQKNPIIIFPQTIYYTDTENGEEEKRKSLSYYNKCRNLTIVARERKSFEIMKKLYSDVKILLTPDIVLSTTKKDYDVKQRERKNILLCFRSDPERSMSDEERKSVQDYLNEQQYQYILTDMHSKKSVTVANRKEIVQEKMNEFAGTKLVITDRLHAMIFAALTETPCIVFSNYNQKVSGTYEWIKYLPYIRFVDGIEKINQYIEEMLNIEKCFFDNSVILKQYEELEKVIKKYVN